MSKFFVSRTWMNVNKHLEELDKGIDNRKMPKYTFPETQCEKVMCQEENHSSGVKKKDLKRFVITGPLSRILRGHF